MTDAPATNELLALADRMETHVVSRLPGSEPVVTNGAWQMMLDAATALCAAATPSAQGAEVSVDELARELIRADGNTVTTSNENWPRTLAFHEEMRAEYPDYENGYSLVTDAFRRARALLGKYRMEKR